MKRLMLGLMLVLGCGEEGVSGKVDIGADAGASDATAGEAAPSLPMCQAKYMPPGGDEFLVLGCNDLGPNFGNRYTGLPRFKNGMECATCKLPGDPTAVGGWRTVSECMAEGTFNYRTIFVCVSAAECETDCKPGIY